MPRERKRRPKVDLDERFSLYPMDPEDALRKVLQGTKKKVAQEAPRETDDSEGSQRES